MEDGPILIVDDEEAIRDVIADLLSGEGYRVQTASNGAAALCALDRILPSLILLDLHMPVLDGFGFVAALAARGLAVPIVLVSAGTSLAKHAAALGAVGCIAKPFEIVDLLMTVERCRRAA